MELTGGNVRRHFNLRTIIAILLVTCWSVHVLAIGSGPTTTTLTISPPSPVAGQVVTLTASVKSNFGQVSQGTVTFLDGNTNAVLGTSQIVDSGAIVATLLVRFGPGTHLLSARYDGNNNFASSQSIPQMLIVQGTEPTISTLTATPNGNNYDFDLSVFGFGLSALAGSAALNDLTDNNFLLGTINVAGPGMLGYQAAANYPAGPQPYFIVSGDFNNDGVPDLAVSNGDGLGTTLNVLLGKPDGSFQAPKTISLANSPLGIAVGDFNADGNLDLAAADFNPKPGVSVFFGNGDGTFGPEQYYQVGVQGSAVAVGDFNNDGFLDIAVTDTTGLVKVLLNQGDGTFKLVNQNLDTGLELIAIVTGDFNNDGNLDVAVLDHFGQFQQRGGAVLLGNGDGTFQAAKPFPAGNFPFGLAAGDLNKDGKLDLVVSNTQDGTASVLLGNGDGTFQVQPAINVGNGPAGVVLADLNGDGLLDMAVSTGISNGNTISVLLGNGNGTFQAPQAFSCGSGAEPAGLVSADFNGDSVPDLAAANQVQNSAAVLLGGTVSTGLLKNVQIPGKSGHELPGLHSVQSNFTPGGNFYAGSLSNLVQVNGGVQLPTQTTLSSSVNPSTYLQAVTFTATVMADAGIPTGTVTFTSDGNVICSAVPLIGGQNNSTATCTVATLTPGSHTIVGAYSGDANFQPSSGTLAPPQMVNQAGTTVALISAPNPSTYLQTVTFTATVTGANGGSPTGTVNFTADGVSIPGCGAVQLSAQQQGSSAACQTATLLVGSHGIIALYSGDADFAVSESRILAQVVRPAATNTVVTAMPPSPAQLGQTVTFTAGVTGANGGNPTGTVSFAADNIPIAGCTAVPLAPQQQGSVATCQTSSLILGSHTISATYSGDMNFTPSSGSLTYAVQVGDFTIGVSPNNIQVAQGFSNDNQPFSAQAINVAVAPIMGYNNTVTLTCSVSPALTGGGCTVNPPTSGQVDANLNTTLTINVGSATPLGSYSVTITGQDSNQVTHSVTLALTVISNNASGGGGTMASGGSTRVSINFQGPPNTTLTNLACTSVTGTGITGSESLSQIGGICVFDPPSVMLPGSVMVTISGCTVARLRRSVPIYASFFFGLPALAMVVPLGASRRRRKELARKLLLFIVAMTLLLGLGCGGGYGPLTPTGHYYVLVQGTGSDSQTYSAIFPLTVTPLNH